MTHIGPRDHDALLAGQLFKPADIVMTFDLFIDATDRLNLAILID